MAITALPTPPQRTQTPAVFSANGDAFLAALPTFVTEANALQADVNTKQTTASTAATTATTQAGIATTQAALATTNGAAQVALATTQANNAATSAASAVNSAQTQATSTTSLTCGTGSQSLTLAQTGKLFSVGQTVNISDSTGSNIMTGPITAFNSGTGAMTVNVTVAVGTATVAAWTISVGAPIQDNSFMLALLCASL